MKLAILLYYHSRGANLPPELVMVIFLVVVGIAIYNFLFSKAAVIRRKLRESEGRRISSVKDGEVAKVVGRVVFPGRTLSAPLSKRKCSYFHVLVEVHHGKGGWQTLIEEEKAGDVVLQDGKYYAVVQTGKVNTFLVADKEYSSGTFNDASEVLEKYLGTHGQRSTDFLGFNRSLRYKEGVLEKNEVAAVLGKARWANKWDSRLNIPAEKVLILEPSDTEPVYMSDAEEATSAQP
ncbi:MAG TPA: hypothetical protein VI112_01980 [Bacteroidia bacterium]|jgi:hypothetical protein